MFFSQEKSSTDIWILMFGRENDRAFLFLGKKRKKMGYSLRVTTGEIDISAFNPDTLSTPIAESRTQRKAYMTLMMTCKEEVLYETGNGRKRYTDLKATSVTM